MKICSMCRSQLPDNYNACPTCGNQNLEFVQNVQQPVNNGYGVQMPGQYGMSVDDQLVRSFVGNNYDKISTKSWNWAAGLLSPAYLIYRKIYVLGIPIYVFNYFLSKVNNVAILLFDILLIIVAGSQFNKMYMDYAKKQVEKIKAENPNVDFNTLNSIVANKGGANLGLMFVIIIAVAVLCTIVSNLVF